MYVLDTNVVSEFLREQPNVNVQRWIDRQRRNTLYVSVVTELELRFGTEILEEGRRKTGIKRLTDRMFDQLFEHRVLPLTRKAVVHYLEFAANRRALGLHVPILDCQIAATTKTQEMTLVTRNEKDFVGMDVDLINPWRG